jgi:hypothetical protein
MLFALAGNGAVWEGHIPTMARHVVRRQVYNVTQADMQDAHSCWSTCTRLRSVKQAIEQLTLA